MFHARGYSNEREKQLVAPTGLPQLTTLKQSLFLYWRAIWHKGFLKTRFSIKYLHLHLVVENCQHHLVQTADPEQ